MEVQHLRELSAALIFIALLLVFRLSWVERKRRALFNGILPGYRAPRRQYFFEYRRVPKGANPEFEQSLKIRIRNIEILIKKFETKVKMRHGGNLTAEELSIEDDFAAISIQDLTNQKRELLNAVKSFNHSTLDFENRLTLH